MSMRGENISKEYQRMVWITDNKGRQYACYAEDLKGKIREKKDLTEEERQNCMDLSEVLGDNW